MVISPGSRNAPLTISFVNDDRFKCWSIPDERSAGFFALGIAQKKEKPTIVHCTSGSAVVNLSGAVLEAYYQHVPMLVITADRPAEWTDQGDGQTMRQQGVFGNFIKGSYQVPQRVESDDEHWYVQRILNEAIELAMHGEPGPVHINMPFSEPLYETDDAIPEVKFIDQMQGERKLTEKDLNTLVNEWNNVGKKLIIAGQHPPQKRLLQTLEAVGSAPDVSVLTETTSNLWSPKFNKNIDRLISAFNEDEAMDFMPDLLITFGNHVISKKIKALLRNAQPKAHWHITENGTFIDTFKSLTRLIQCKPGDLLERLAMEPGKEDSTFGALWKQRDLVCEEKHNAFMAECPFSDMKAFHFINEYLPEPSVLHMSNSTSVRYVQLFNQVRDIRYMGNRGVSGIDGCTSTALGYAGVTDEMVTLVTGEVGFLYDSNAFFNHYRPKNLKVIVINNGGGNIFRIIDGPLQNEKSLPYFETPHAFELGDFCNTHDITYFRATDEGSLDEALKLLFYESDGLALLEIDTRNCKNDEVLKSYFRALKS